MKRFFLFFVSVFLCFVSSCNEEDLSKVLSVVCNGKSVTAEGVTLEAQSGVFIEVRLKNSSEKYAVSFTNIASDRPDHIKIQNPPKVLNAASETTFKVLYEGVSSSFSANVTIEYKVGTGFSSVLTIPVKVNGEEEAAQPFLELVEPEGALLDFGTVTSGTVSKTLAVTVRNVSDSSFRVTSIGIGGTDAAAFRIENGTELPASSEIGLDFAAGETRQFDIAFAPSVSGEYSDAAFSVLWETGSIDVLLKGTSREPDPEEVILTVLKDDTILTSGSVVSFGEISAGVSPAPAVTFTLKNGSTVKPLTVEAVEFLPADGVTADRSAFTIAASGSETLTVTLNPVSAGGFASDLTIRSDATEPENGLFTLKLTATVIEPMPVMRLSGEGLTEDPSGNGHYALAMPDTVFEPEPVGVFREILISNDGTAELIIEKVTIPDGVGLTADAVVPLSVAPGESAALKLSFIPLSEENLDAVIALSGNNRGSETETLIAVTGKIGSDLPLLPPSLLLTPVADLNSEKYYIDNESLTLTISTASGSKGIGEFAYALFEGSEAEGTALKEGSVAASETEGNAVIVLTDVPFVDKQYTFSVTDSDKEGILSEPALLRFYVDKTVPSKPESVSLDASIETISLEGVDVTADENLIWNWTVPANESTKPNNNIRHSEYRVSDGTVTEENEIWTQVSVGKTNPFAAGDGKTYTVEVRFVDEFGRVSESTVSQPVSVDRNLPEAPSDLRLKDSILAVQAENGVRTAATDLVWTWTADSALTYRYSINGGASSEAVNGEAFFTAETDGSYTIEVKSVNHLGLESSAVTHTVTVDTSKPQTVLENITVTVASDKHSEEDGGIWYVDDPAAVLGWTGTDGWNYRYISNTDEWKEASGSGTSFVTSALDMTDDALYTVSVYAVNELGTVSDTPQTVNIRPVTAAPQLMIENSVNSGIEVDVWNDISSKWNGADGLLSGMVFKVSSDGTDWETVALDTPSSDKITVTMDDSALLKALNKPGADKSVYDYDNRYAEVNTKTVTFTATGRFGKTDVENVTVFLKDTTAPVITNPNLGTFAFGSQDNFTITIKDNSGKYDGTAQSYALMYGGYKAGYVAGTMTIPVKDASDNTAEVTLTVNAPSTENMVGNGNFSDITDTDKITDSNTSGLTFGTPTGWGFNSGHSHFAYGGDGGWITEITYCYEPKWGNLMLVCGAINNGTKYGYMTLSKWSAFNNTNVEIYTTESNTAASKTLYEGVEYELSYKYKDYTISSGVNTFQNGATVSVSKRNGAGQFASADSFSIVRTPQASGTAYVKDALNQSFNSQSGKVKVNGGNISGVTVTYVYGNTAGTRYTENYCGSIITDVTFKAVSWPKAQANGSVTY